MARKAIEIHLRVGAVCERVLMRSRIRRYEWQRMAEKELKIKKERIIVE